MFHRKCILFTRYPIYKLSGLCSIPFINYPVYLGICSAVGTLDFSTGSGRGGYRSDRRPGVRTARKKSAASTIEMFLHPFLSIVPAALTFLCGLHPRVAFVSPSLPLRLHCTSPGLGSVVLTALREVLTYVKRLKKIRF